MPPSDTPRERSQQQQRRQQEEDSSATTAKNVTTAYRLRHLTCSLRPTVSCHQLDYTRIGHPSDIPPLVTDNELQMAGVASGGAQDILHLRLVIPNIAPTSIRCADHHRSCMAHTSEQGGLGDSLSIAHQRQGLLVTASGGAHRSRRSSTYGGDAIYE